MKKSIKGINLIMFSLCLCMMTGCDFVEEKVEKVSSLVETAKEEIISKVEAIFASEAIESMIKDINESENEIMDQTAIAIVTALENEDVEAMKALFSKEALENADNIDEQIQEAIDFYEGNMQNYVPAHHSRMSKNDGITIIEYMGLYTIETDRQTYELRFEMVERNDANPDMAGVMTIELTTLSKRIQDDFMWQAYWKDGDYGVYIQE